MQFNKAVLGLLASTALVLALTDTVTERAGSTVGDIGRSDNGIRTPEAFHGAAGYLPADADTGVETTDFD